MRKDKKEWELYLVSDEMNDKEYLGMVVAESPKKAIELFFESEEDINIVKNNKIEIYEKGKLLNIFEYKRNKIKKISYPRQDIRSEDFNITAK